MTQPIQFADTVIYPSGNSNAFIAKYVDTSFMTPYVHTEDSGEVHITLVDDGAALVAYPNPFRQRVTIRLDGTQASCLRETAILTDITGRREEVRLTPTGDGQYSLDLSSRPQATYLLTLTTADGRQHTVRLLKQSDIFGN
ncbi:MAG: T9SS type A sorting domain-containing protein [Bacteroidales bacterium]|nr:T9SS type A sorting domain-containing protein [Bacteroidales bacterium]